MLESFKLDNSFQFSLLVNISVELCRESSHYAGIIKESFPELAGALLFFFSNREVNEVFVVGFGLDVFY